MWILPIILIWLRADYYAGVMAHQMSALRSVDTVMNYEREFVIRNSIEEKADDDALANEWQDCVLASAIVANYLNTLMVFTSKQDFQFVIPTGYSIKYVKYPNSTWQTVSQLANDMRTVLLDAHEDLNRVETGMARIPNHLKTMLLLVKQGNLELLIALLPDSFNDIEKLVNDSLVVLKNPTIQINQVQNLITEIDVLLSATVSQNILLEQVRDIKIQWSCLVKLFTQLAKQAEKTRESFLLQFGWILQEFIRPDLQFTEAERDFIIRLLKPKVIEIDRTSDLLSVVSRTFSDVSSDYTSEQLGGNSHLLLLTDEQVRQRYLKQFRYELIPQVVKITRLASLRHQEFLRRNKERENIYNHFIQNASPADLISLLG